VPQQTSNMTVFLFGFRILLTASTTFWYSTSAAGVFTWKKAPGLTCS